MTTKPLPLYDVFEKLSKSHKVYMQKRIVRIVLGSSVIRVFEKDTKKDLIKHLENIRVDILKDFDTLKFNNWFFKELSLLSSTITLKNKNNKKLGKGLEFGHSAKILNLFLSHIVCQCRYFNDDDMNKIRTLLHAPIDSQVIQNFPKDKLPVNPETKKPIKAIKEIATKDIYNQFQEEIRNAAKLKNQPPIIFDDYAWTNRKN